MSSANSLATANHDAHALMSKMDCEALPPDSSLPERLIGDVTVYRWPDGTTTYSSNGTSLVRDPAGNIRVPKVDLIVGWSTKQVRTELVGGRGDEPLQTRDVFVHSDNLRGRLAIGEEAVRLSARAVRAVHRKLAEAASRHS